MGAACSTRSCSVSSNDMNTPGSSNSSAPRTRNSSASTVLPQLALPQTSVGRFFGNPPPVISSRPLMPVAAFSATGGGDAMLRQEDFLLEVGRVVLAFGIWFSWWITGLRA